MNLEWLPVESSRITHYAYVPEQGAIYVVFTNNVTWQYRECGPEVWEQFQYAPSKGRFINEVLKSSSSWTRVKSPEAHKLRQAR